MDTTVERNERTWAMLAHLANLLNMVTAIGGFVTALAIWLAFKPTSPLVERQARESMNFQITLLIAFVASALTIIGLVLWPVLWLVGVILPIVAAARVGEGVDYRYPFVIRLIAEPAPPHAPAPPPPVPSGPETVTA